VNGVKFAAALGAGLVASIVVAIVWGAVTAATSFQIGYMAVGVGFAVAFAVRFAGRSHGQAFAVMSAALSLFGCLLGNYFAAIGVLVAHDHVDPLGATIVLAPHAVDILSKTFNFMDLVFYALGIWCGYKYALIPLKPVPPAAEPVQ